MVAFAAGQDDQVGIARERLARADEDEVDVRLDAQRIEIVEIGDAREHAARRSCTCRSGRAPRRVAEAERVLGRQARGGGEERDEAERAPAGALCDAPPCRSSNSRRRRGSC